MNRLIEWIFGLPWWGALLVLAALLLAIDELGFRLARVRHSAASAAGESKDGVRASQVSVVLGALLALLGLLLAFSFGIVEERYAVRKALVIEEANAIGTSYLRAGLLPEQHGQKIRQLLRDYVEVRLGQPTPDALQEAIERSEQIHVELWNEAEVVGTADPNSEVVGRFLSSLNQVIDLHTSRVSITLHQRLPPAIFNVLFTVSMVSMLVLGYGSGLARWRALIPVAALVVSVSSVLVLIQQLDSPGTRLFRVSQWAMQDVQRTMKPPAADARSNR